MDKKKQRVMHLENITDRLHKAWWIYSLILLIYMLFFSRGEIFQVYFLYVSSWHVRENKSTINEFMCIEYAFGSNRLKYTLIFSRFVRMKYLQTIESIKINSLICLYNMEVFCANHQNAFTMSFRTLCK
jgi:hypothetical protein